MTMPRKRWDAMAGSAENSVTRVGKCVVGLDGIRYEAQGQNGTGSVLRPDCFALDEPTTSMSFLRCWVQILPSPDVLLTLRSLDDALFGTSWKRGRRTSRLCSANISCP